MRVYVDANLKQLAYVTVELEGSKADVFHLTKTVTNNEAEYLAIIFALEAQPATTEILSDSQLVVNQLNHKWHIKENKLRVLALNVWGLAKGQVTFLWIPRKENLAGKLLG